MHTPLSCHMLSAQAFPWNSVSPSAAAGGAGGQLLCPVCRAPLTDAEIGQLPGTASSGGGGGGGGFACCRSCQFQIVGGAAERSPAVDGTAAAAESTAALQALLPMPLIVRSEVLSAAAAESLRTGEEPLRHDTERLRRQIQEWLLF